jgi:hypothetical protein
MAPQAGSPQRQHEARPTGLVGHHDHANGGMPKAGRIEAERIGRSQVALDAQPQVRRERLQTATVTR